MPIVLRFAARSDIGLVRKNNQDSGYAGPNLAVLADGMGGPAGGDIASSVAVAHLAPLDSDTHAADDLLDLLRAAVGQAHDELRARSLADPQLQGLGTTCIALLRSGNKLAMVHVGDSRAYLLHEGSFTQVTTDHSYVQYLISLGQLTPEKAASHPQRGVVLRILGDHDGPVELDESLREAVPGDRWLLCSDGLSGIVSVETIAEVLSTEPDPDQAAEILVDLALRGGGSDNITCVIVDVLDATTSEVSNTPQIVGAVATDRLNKTRGGSGAAAKAAALTAADPVADPEDEPDKPTRNWAKIAVRSVIGLLLGALVGGGGYLGVRWTQTQYYVAAKDGSVWIFQGIPQSIGPLSFSEPIENTGLKIAGLSEVAQTRLESPITRSSLAEARKVVESLSTFVTPKTTPASSAPPPSASLSPAPAPTASKTSG